MKYRITKAKSGFKIVQDPDGENKSLGTEKTIEKAKEKVLKIMNGG